MSFLKIYVIKTKKSRYICIGIMSHFSSTILSKYITAYFNAKRVDINMTKIQKLTYIFYGSWLAIKNQRLIDEHPQAWPYGPVFPTSRNKLLKVDLNTISLRDDELREISRDKEINSLMNLVYNTFGSWSASSLSAWSHKEGSPWEKTVSNEKFKWGDVINDDDIRSYFKKIIIINDGKEEK